VARELVLDMISSVSAAVLNMLAVLSMPSFVSNSWNIFVLLTS
jgi:hypothetical protein